MAGRLEIPLADLLAERTPGRAAVSRLPTGCGLVVRLLAESSDRLRRVQRRVLSVARERLLGRGVWALGKG